MSASLDPRITTPYPGLRPFQQYEHPIFFGRGEQTRAMLKPLAEHRFLAVVGASGSGKSSLVRAGLLPALEQGMLRSAGRDWSMIIMRPGNDPFGNLARELHTVVEDEGSTAITEATLRGASSGFLQCLDDLEVSTDANVLLLVDQFEEIIRYSRQSDDARGTATAFVDLMLTTARVTSTRRVHVVLTTRSDFLGDCNAFPGLPEAINDSQFLTPRLQRDEIRQAIVGPLRSFDTSADEELINRILNDVGSDPDQLPLMQHALLQTWVRAQAVRRTSSPSLASESGDEVATDWKSVVRPARVAEPVETERKPPGIHMTLAHYRDAGGVARALHRHAEAAYEALASVTAQPVPPSTGNVSSIDSEPQRIAKVLFKCLSDRSQEARLTRQLITVREVADIAGVEWEDVRDVVPAFQDEHRNFLYSPDKTLTPESTLDISHESLLRQWSRANEWMAEEEESANFYRQLLNRARKWDQTPPQAALLYSPDLENAQEWQQAQSPTAAWCQRVARTMTTVEDEPGYDVYRKYLEASVWAASKARRLLRAGVVSLLVLLSITSFAFAILARRESKQAATYAGEAIDNQVSSYLALRDASGEQQRNKEAIYWSWLASATMRDREPRARRILQRLADWSFREPYAWEHQGPVYTAVFSPDGKTVLTASGDSTARLWDTTHGAPRGELMKHLASVGSAVFSPDGETVLTASDDFTARLWDADGTPRGEPMRHQSFVLSAAFSPDGKTVLTTCYDNKARLWDAQDGTPRGQPLDHQAPIRSGVFSPDGKTVVTASDDDTAQLWDAADGTPRGEPMRHQRSVRSAIFSPTGELVLTASDDNTARLWDARDGMQRGERMQHDGVVNSAVFSPDGNTVSTASSDRTARLWDAKNGTPRGEPMRHQASVRSAAFSPDGNTVATASDDRTARLWDAKNGTPRSEPMRHQASVRSAMFSPDGNLVLTSSDNTFRLWDATDGHVRQTLASASRRSVAMRHQAPVRSAVFSRDGKAVLTISDGATRLWNASDGTPRGQLLHKHSVEFAFFSPDGKTVLTVNSDDTVRLWDVIKGEPLVESMPHGGRVLSAAFSPDGKLVLTASNDNTARVWDATTGRPLGEPLRHRDSVQIAVFSPDGMMVLTSSLDGTARLWDIRTGRQIAPPMHHTDFVQSAEFSPDVMTVLTTSANTAQLWDTRTVTRRSEPMQHQGNIRSAIFSPSGKLVLTASDDKTARLWNASDGQPIGRAMQHRDRVRSAVFSPDGKTVFTASDDYTARLWNAGDGTPRGIPIVHHRAVNSAVFSGDGELVLTASDDNTARLWNAADGTSIGAPMLHEGPVRSAVLSPDGKTVLTASNDDTARLWDVPMYSAIDPRQSDRARDWLQLSVECRTGLTRALDRPRGFRELTYRELVERVDRVRNEFDGRLADGSAPIPDELLGRIQADDDEPDHGTHKLVFAVCVIVVLAIAIAVLSRRSRGATAARSRDGARNFGRCDLSDFRRTSNSCDSPRNSQ